MRFTRAKILVHHDQIVFFSLIYDALDHLSNVAVAMDETVKTEVMAQKNDAFGLHGRTSSAVATPVH